MEKVKQVCSIIMDKALPIIISIAGPLLMAYFMWVQTVGFTYVTAMNCVFALLIGILIGFCSLTYLKNQKVKDQKSILSMVRAYVFCFIVLMVETAIASDVSFFLIGVGGCAMCWMALLYYLIWQGILPKREKNVKAE